MSASTAKGPDPNAVIGADSLLQGKYVLAQRGKKNYYLLIAE